jgi:hypothetical protein
VIRFVANGMMSFLKESMIESDGMAESANFIAASTRPYMANSVRCLCPPMCTRQRRRCTSSAPG